MTLHAGIMELVAQFPVLGAWQRRGLDPALGLRVLETRPEAPRCLVTNCRWRLVEDYALRFWHEQSFRDLKSAGFQWNQSAVWSPTHAHRLLFILAVANAWVMAQGLLHAPPEKPSPSRTCPPLSLFQRGLRWVHETLKVGPLWPFSPDLAFTLPQPLLC